MLCCLHVPFSAGPLLIFNLCSDYRPQPFLRFITHLRRFEESVSNGLQPWNLASAHYRRHHRHPPTLRRALSNPRLQCSPSKREQGKKQDKVVQWSRELTREERYASDPLEWKQDERWSKVTAACLPLSENIPLRPELFAQCKVEQKASRYWHPSKSRVTWYDVSKLSVAPFT